MDPIRVLLAEDDPAYRRLVASVLEAENDIELVGEAGDGEEAIALVTEHAPQVVVMDIGMPKLSGIDAASVLNEMHPATKMLMLTISDEESDLFEAIKAGASGYLLKDTDPDGVVDAVRLVQIGQAIVSPKMAAKLREELLRSMDSEHDALRPLITKVELDVLSELARSVTTDGVADKLGMSRTRMNHHLNNLLKKLHASHRMQLVAEAVRDELHNVHDLVAEGLVSEDIEDPS